MPTVTRLQTVFRTRVVTLVLVLALGALGGATYAPSMVAAADPGVLVQEDGSCPSGYPVKAVMSEEGDRLAYVPDDPFYEAISPAVCFVSDGAAVASGYALHPH